MTKHQYCPIIQNLNCAKLYSHISGIRMITVSNLTKQYGSFKALQNASFSIEKNNGITALLGPNGAGKTTTMRLLTGFLSPTEGNIKIDGLDIGKEEDLLKARRKIGYLPETTPLYNEMLVSEFLAFMGRVHGLDEPTLEKRGKELLDLLELGSHFHTPIGLLSKGFRQRIALAATLIHEPEIIILDEPTSGLDPNQIVHIRNLIRELGKTSTLILSTHILQEVEDICDRVIIIDNGKIVADDSMENLKQTSQKIVYDVVAKNQENAINQLESIDNVNNVQEFQASEFMQIPDGYRSFRCELASKEPENLLNTLIQKNWQIRGFMPINKSLEDIFKELTTN